MVYFFSAFANVSGIPYNNMNRVKRTLRALPEKKQYFELVGAMLSIPVLITVILLNTNSLKNSTAKKDASSPTPATVVVTEKDRLITQPPQVIYENNPSGGNASCTKQVGQVRIASPNEDEVVATNPVCLDIVSVDVNACPAVYSYRVDNGAWSDFSKNTVCLYNLKAGKHSVDVKVKSSLSDDVVQLRRSFQSGTTDAVTPTQTPTPTPTK